MWPQYFPQMCTQCPVLSAPVRRPGAPYVFSHPIRSAGGRIECWGRYGCKTKPSLTSETETSGPSWAPHRWDRKLFSWHMCGLVCLCVFSSYELYVANVLRARLHKTWPPSHPPLLPPFPAPNPFSQFHRGISYSVSHCCTEGSGWFFILWHSVD